MRNNRDLRSAVGLSRLHLVRLSLKDVLVQRRQHVRQLVGGAPGVQTVRVVPDLQAIGRPGEQDTQPERRPPRVQCGADLPVPPHCLLPRRVVTMDEQRDVLLSFMIRRVLNNWEGIGRRTQLSTKYGRSASLPGRKAFEAPSRAGCPIAEPRLAVAQPALTGQNVAIRDHPVCSCHATSFGATRLYGTPDAKSRARAARQGHGLQ